MCVDEQDFQVSTEITSRRHARLAAVQVLYACDTLGECSEAAHQNHFQHFFGSVAEQCEHTHVRSEIESYAHALVSGVLAHLLDVDKKLEGCSEHWSLDRMTRTDRNILRVAAFEMMYVTEVPVSVSINEAIEVSKILSCPEAHLFINGVLDKIAHAVRAEELAKLQKTA